MGDVPICTMLSGGIDSVLTTYYVLKNIEFDKVNFNQLLMYLGKNFIL